MVACCSKRSHARSARCIPRRFRAELCCTFRGPPSEADGSAIALRSTRSVPALAGREIGMLGYKEFTLALRFSVQDRVFHSTF
jgi:hypothetical protein